MVEKRRGKPEQLPSIEHVNIATDLHECAKDMQSRIISVFIANNHHVLHKIAEQLAKSHYNFDTDELVQETVIKCLTLKNTDKFEQSIKDQKGDRYLYGIMRMMVCSKSEKFYKEHYQNKRRNIRLPNTILAEINPNDETRPRDPANKQLRDIFQGLSTDGGPDIRTIKLNTIDQAVKKLSKYEQLLVTIIFEHGYTVNKVANEATINRKALTKDLQDVVEKLQKLVDNETTQKDGPGEIPGTTK